MNAVNVVQLFILVWTFTAVCHADEYFSVSCDDVMGSVGKEVTLTCSISLQDTKCCIKMYKFQYPKSINDTAICKEEPPVNPCEQRNSFTCSYTPTTAVTEQFRFFMQATCGQDKTEFTVNTEGYLRDINPENPSGSPPPETAVGLVSKDTGIAVVVSGFIILLLIMMMTIFWKTKPNSTKLFRFKNRMLLSVRHDEDNNHPENKL